MLMLSALIRTIRFLRSPLLALAWAAEFLDDRLTTPRHRRHLSYYFKRQLPVSEGVAAGLGVDISIVNEQLSNLPNFLAEQNKDPGMMIKWSATSELAAATYAVVRMLRPEVVVETGVGAGVSSWTILKAMDENGMGCLVSIDLPTPNTELLPEVGYLVPNELRGRWDLRTGSSRRLLPKVFEEFPEVDMFQHDSRHSYSNQLSEYQIAWPHIRLGGLLISDDVSNDALYEASLLWNVEPTIIGQSKNSPIGLVRRN